MITYIRIHINLGSKLTTQFCLCSLHSPLHGSCHQCRWPQNNSSFHFSWAPNPYSKQPTRCSTNHLKLTEFNAEIMIYPPTLNIFSTYFLLLFFKLLSIQLQNLKIKGLFFTLCLFFICKFDEELFIVSV